MKSFIFGKKSNRGVSLVELVVVIAIMTVLVGAVSIGIGMVSTKPATQCASNIQICLNRCRTHTMGKTKGLVGFYADSEGVWMVEKLGYSNTDLDDSSDCFAEDYTKKKIGKKGVTISVDEAGTSIPALDSPIVFYFKRSDGSLDNTSANCIYISKGKKKYKVTVQKLTGKVEMTKL